MKARMAQAVLILLTCSACTSMQTLPPGRSYVSPLGEFSCMPYPKSEMGVQAVFGPHGGTVRLIFYDLDMTRIDVEEFEPKIEDPAYLKAHEQNIYEGHLIEGILPLVKQGVPNAKIVRGTHAEFNGHRVHVSAILLPEKSNSMFPSGKYADGVRAQIQYTNGRFIYTVSRIDPVNMRADWNADQNIDNSIRIISETFGTCTFPK